MNLENIIISVVAFVVLTIFLYLWNSRKAKLILGKKKAKKKNKKYEIIEVKYLMITYGLSREKLLTPKIILLTSLIDAFIISLVFLVVVILPWKIYWQLLVGFALLMGLIYSLYGIIGKILVKKGYKE